MTQIDDEINEDEIVELMKQHPAFQMIEGGEKTLKELVPSLLETCEELNWSLEKAIAEAGNIMAKRQSQSKSKSKNKSPLKGFASIHTLAL